MTIPSSHEHSRTFLLHRRQRGAATLVVVMILFFIMAMMAAYANRSLIFEQRIASNYYRAGVAFEAADAGIDWTLAMLNSTSNVDTDCKASPAGASTFRQRYLNLDSSSSRSITTVNPSPSYVAACVRPVGASANWKCLCPAAPPIPNISVAAAAQMQPSFQVNLLGTAAGIVTITSIGCTSSTPSMCLIDGASTAMATKQLIGGSQIKLQVALVSALKAPPAAPLTVRGNVGDGAGRLGLHNTDTAGTGLLLLSGGSGVLSDARLDSLPGTPGQQALSMNDGTLSGIASDGAMFSRFFGMSQPQYQTQPAIRDAGCTTSCGDSNITDAITAGAQMIWANGPLTLSGNGTFGSATRPVIIVANGDVTISGSVTINGVLYAVGNITAGAPQITVNGAVIGGKDFTIGSGLMDVNYQSPIINTVNNALGSFVRVPGSWFEGLL